MSANLRSRRRRYVVQKRCNPDCECLRSFWIRKFKKSTGDPRKVPSLWRFNSTQLSVHWVSIQNANLCVSEGVSGVWFQCLFIMFVCKFCLLFEKGVYQGQQYEPCMIGGEFKCQKDYMACPCSHIQNLSLFRITTLMTGEYGMRSLRSLPRILQLVKRMASRLGMEMVTGSGR